MASHWCKAPSLNIFNLTFNFFGPLFKFVYLITSLRCNWNSTRNYWWIMTLSSYVNWMLLSLSNFNRLFMRFLNSHMLLLFLFSLLTGFSLVRCRFWSLLFDAPCLYLITDHFLFFKTLNKLVEFWRLISGLKVWIL